MGAIVAAWSTYGTFQLDSSWSWKIPSLLQGLVSLFQAIFIFCVPESPRWLIANGRTEDATRILCKYHSGSEEPTELVRLQVAEITCAIDFERSFESSSYIQFFRTSESHALLPSAPDYIRQSIADAPDSVAEGNRHRLFIAASLGFIIQWCGNQVRHPSHL